MEQDLRRNFGLVQGMAQLQSAMAASMSGKIGEPEVVKPGVGGLPTLPEFLKPVLSTWEIGCIP